MINVLYPKNIQMDEEKIINWCLWLWHQPEDWTINGSRIELDKLPNLYLKDDIRYQYNQWSSSDCTIYGSIGAISDLFNYEFSAEEIDEINEESYKRGRTRWAGWYVQSAVKLVCQRWNERHKDQTVAYYYISKYETDVIEKVLKKNYTLVTGYNGSSLYKKDRDDNLQIDNNDWWEYSYGHCIDVIWKDNRKSCKDSYKWRKSKGRDSNIYWFIPNFSDCKSWHNGFYLIVQEDEDKIEDKKRLNKMKNLIDNIDEHSDALIPLDSQMRESTHDKEYQEQLHIVNETLRKLKSMNEKKRTDIEKELSKYFIS